MSSTTPRRSFFMVYRAEDFPLYLLSLVLGGLLIAPVLPHVYAQVALVAALAYLGCFFVMRHGAKFESSVFRAIAEGVTRYPGMLLRNWRTASHIVIPIVVLFTGALTAEHFLAPSLARTFWLKAFPWRWAVWTPFLLLTVFRMAILVAHLLRAGVVREVLAGSPQRRSIARLSIYQHMLQAFVTGVIAHLSLVAPCILFFMLTGPTYLREALLVGGHALWFAIAMPLRKRKVLDRPGSVYNRLFFENHSEAHQSRFFFTVFHGHHHDSIPSAMIGSAAGTGFLENTDRSFTWLDPLNSIVLVQLNWLYMVAFDMVVHQYIPGVFPFVKPTLVGGAHHVTHHFGSALPLGIVFNGYVEPRDIAAGYKPDNAVTRWFLAEAERRETFDPKLREKFLTVGAKAAPVVEAAVADVPAALPEPVPAS